MRYLILAAALLLVACGGDDDDGPTTNETSATSTPAGVTAIAHSGAETERGTARRSCNDCTGAARSCCTVVAHAEQWAISELVVVGG